MTVRYYVFFVGSTENIKKNCCFHINTETRGIPGIKAYIRLKVPVLLDMHLFQITRLVKI